MVQIMLTEWQWPDELRHLICTPLSHAGATFYVPVLLRGGSLVVIPKFDAGQVLEAIERHRITSVFLVPSMLYALLDHPRFADTDLTSLQTVFYGASPISPTRLQEAIRALGPDLLPVLRPDRGAADAVRHAQGGARPGRPGPAGQLRATGAVGARRPPR